MKNPELFHKTVAILVKAYQENTLEHTNCYACAVQNIVAGNMGYCIIPKPKNHLLSDFGHITVVIPNIIYEQTLTANLHLDEDKLTTSLLRELKSTGYSIGELNAIEWAFERIDVAECDGADDYIFQGLISVVGVLMRIHEATETEATKAKKLFVKTPELV